MEPQAKFINFKKKTSALPDVFPVFFRLHRKVRLTCFSCFRIRRFAGCFFQEMVRKQHRQSPSTSEI